MSRSFNSSMMPAIIQALAAMRHHMHPHAILDVPKNRSCARGVGSEISHNPQNPPPGFYMRKSKTGSIRHKVSHKRRKP